MTKYKVNDNVETVYGTAKVIEVLAQHIIVRVFKPYCRYDSLGRVLKLEVTNDQKYCIRN